MKKIFLLLLSVILVFLILYKKQTSASYKVLKIVSPIEIFIDTNNNFIFDEQTPVKIKDIDYIDEAGNDYKYPFLKDLSEDEIFFISYKTKHFSEKILNNQFIQLKNNEIYIKNKKYSDILLDSHLVFDKTKESQDNFIKKVKSYNLDDYVIYNIRSKRYHKLNCEKAKSIKNYKIIKRSELNNSATPCPYCHLNNDSTPKDTKCIKKPNPIYKADKIQVFFIDLNTVYKPMSTCKTDACKTLKNEINNAKDTINFAVYGINNQPEIFNALVNAKKRGVKIRWVCDFDYKNNNYYPDTIKLQQYLTDFKSDKEYDIHSPHAIMHNKFFIFDNQKVWTGSSNITGTDLTGFNANYSVLIDSKETAQAYTKEFNQMYEGKFHTDKISNPINPIKLDESTKILPLFSPNDNIIYNSIIPIINKAEKYIYIPIFFLTHKGIAEALINAHKRGVEIKIINDATNSHSKHSIHKQLRKEGIKVKTENYAGKMHAKSIFVDDKISIIGSMNYTKSANNKNDENIVIIYNQEITKYLKQTFLYLWNKIPNKYETFDPRAESFESTGSCYDGIDNNFDGKIDSQDEGCFIR